MGYSYEPELNLTNDERARLLALSHSEEFRILQKIFKSEIDKFSERLLNANINNPEEILATHALAKSAAQFYQGVVNGINREIQIYKDSHRTQEAPLADEVSDILEMNESDLEDII